MNAPPSDSSPPRRTRRVLWARVVLLFALIAFSALGRHADAQVDASDYGEGNGNMPHVSTQPVVPKSPARALTYSMGGTLVPWVGTAALAAAYSEPPSDRRSRLLLRASSALLFVGGWTVGPSLGHVYAEAYDRVWTGVGLRSAGFLVLVGGQIHYHRTVPEEKREGASLLGLLGLAIVTGSGVYDIMTAPQSARAFNEAHGVQAQITPVLGADGTSVGLTLRMPL